MSQCKPPFSTLGLVFELVSFCLGWLEMILFLLFAFIFKVEYGAHKGFYNGRIFREERTKGKNHIFTLE